MSITLQTIESLPFVSEATENTTLVGWDGQKTIRVAKDAVGSLPSSGEPHQQLVTDANGNTVWEDKLAYTKSDIEWGDERTITVKSGVAQTSGLAGARVMGTCDGIPFDFGSDNRGEWIYYGKTEYDNGESDIYFRRHATGDPCGIQCRDTSKDHNVTFKFGQLSLSYVYVPYDLLPDLVKPFSFRVQVNNGSASCNRVFSDISRAVQSKRHVYCEYDDGSVLNLSYYNYNKMEFTSIVGKTADGLKCYIFRLSSDNTAEFEIVEI